MTPSQGTWTQTNQSMDWFVVAFLYGSIAELLQIAMAPFEAP